MVSPACGPAEAGEVEVEVEAADRKTDATDAAVEAARAPSDGREEEVEQQPGCSSE